MRHSEETSRSVSCARDCWAIHSCIQVNRKNLMYKVPCPIKLFSQLPTVSFLVHRRRRRENRPRRQRTTFSNDQTVKLEIEYNRTEYITRARRYELAEMLCLTENQIKIWFQNRRAKEKRIEKAHLDHHLRYNVLKIFQ